VGHDHEERQRREKRVADRREDARQVDEDPPPAADIHLRQARRLGRDHTPLCGDLGRRFPPTGELQRRRLTGRDGYRAHRLTRDLKRLARPDVDVLAREIRDALVDACSKNGGHLGPNLGVVELTMALHKVLDAPKDKIVWDVSHQVYVHKILTGRRERLDTMRQGGGLSGFAMRSESEYDVFGAGHASTSISAALGMAQARELRAAKRPSWPSSATAR
jgi:hypothetical protein